MAKKLPKQLFVCREGSGENQYFSASETIEETAEDGEVRKVGRYVLQDVSSVEKVPKITPTKN